MGDLPLGEDGPSRLLKFMIAYMRVFTYIVKRDVEAEGQAVA